MWTTVRGKILWCATTKCYDLLDQARCMGPKSDVNWSGQDVLYILKEILTILKSKKKDFVAKSYVDIEKFINKLQQVIDQTFLMAI